MAEHLIIRDDHITYYVMGHPDMSLTSIVDMAITLGPVVPVHKLVCIKALRAGAQTAVARTIVVNEANEEDCPIIYKGLSLKTASLMLERAAASLHPC